NGSNSGAITASDIDWYKITTTGDGALTLNLTETSGVYASLQLYDADGTTTLGNRIDASNGSTSTTVDGLAAGVYYVKIFAYYDGQTPAYSVSNTLGVPSQGNDVEPNGTAAQALTLALNSTKTGHVGYYYNNKRDTLDWYKITTTGDGLIKLNLTSGNNNYVSARLFDADGITQLNYLEAANGTSTVSTDGLAAGTYYVGVYAYYNNQFVPYAITDSLFTPAQANDPEPNGTAAQAVTLGVNGTATGHVGYYNNNKRDTLDWYKITTTADGLIKLNLTSGNNNYVSARLFDADGITQLNYLEAANNTSTVSTDGLAAGTYYIGINAYYNNQFVPYVIKDSLFTTVPNDAEPNGTQATAKPLALNSTTTGHIGYYYNNRRDTFDWYRIIVPQSGAIRLKLTSGNSYYVSARLYNEAGNLQLNYTEAANSTSSVTTDGLGAGIYYVAINAYYNNQFVPYTLTDSLLTYNQNDTLPNTYFSQAPTVLSNRTTTGDVGFLFNTIRDTVDTWKINYTGSDGNLNFTFNLLPHIGDGGTSYVWFQVYKDTAAAPIFNNYYVAASSAINLTGLSQGYYYIRVFAYYNNQFNAYSIANAFTQVNIAAATVKSTRPSSDTCGGNSLTFALSKSHSPYGVQLYRNGLKYDSVNVVSDSARFTNLPTGVYYATVYGDGATDAAFGTSATTTFLPPVPKGLITSNIGVHTATLD
ncbi:MAG: pre-peptidase C-terminal domain-containing protein, partial [Williamsia sp.]|nr:pre-peptidase C-terminal domain-containing protein [Williamsia sp.]